VNKLLALLVFFVFWTNSFSQLVKKFSDDPTVFISELNDFMKLNISDEDEKLMLEFTTAWNMRTFSSEEQERFMSHSNQLIELKARQLPHFRQYIMILLAFKKSDLSQEDFDNWELGFEFLLSKKSTLRAMDQYMTSLIELMNDGTLNNSNSARWVPLEKEYTIVFDGKETYYKFNSTTLRCYAKRDSISIENTSGRFYPNTLKWEGKGGNVTFDRAGFSSDIVNATLVNYKIDLKKSEYDADSVVFINKNFMDQKLIGAFSDKVMQINSQEEALYPQFQSYISEFSIKNLYKGVDYFGGFFFSGSKIVGKSIGGKRSQLRFTKADTTVLKVESNYFIIKKTNITTKLSTVSIYLGADSIYHPSIGFNYNAEKRELSLMPSESSVSSSPYYNSYHKVNIFCQQISWIIDEPYIYLTYPKSTTTNEAKIESENFYNGFDYEKMQGTSDLHPLAAISKLTKRLGRENFMAIELAEVMQKDVSQIRHLLMDLSAQGFIFYTIESDEAFTKQRLYNYINSFMNKIDYDVIDFNSKTEAPEENGYIDIRTMDMLINGIPKIKLSQEQNVLIIPAGKRILMKRNRAFQFDGIVYAGKFTFYGGNFLFMYDSFKINLQNVDSVRIEVEVGKDNYGKPVYQYMKSTVSNVTGELAIDKPNNKSSKKDYPEYPIFNSRESSYVYYDQPKIMEGKYPKNSFFFKLDPFIIDSLDNFDQSELNFQGSFVSSGIFPEIRQKIKLQNDLSFGFKEITPPSGYPIYGGKAQFFNVFELSNKGLHGNGKIQYITSTTKADDFFFYPDSVNSNAQVFDNASQRAGTEFPMVKTENFYMHFMPLIDKFYAYNKEKPFTIINTDITLNGRLLIEPQGMSGKGKMDLTTAFMSSENYKYKSNSFSADTADFSLKSLKSSGFTVLTKNVKAKIDYDKREGIFRSNDEYCLVEFPENKYISYLDFFVWNMNRKEFKMGTEKDYTKNNFSSFLGDSLPGPRYISVKKDQDSLNFVSPEAIYDYQNNYLKAQEVKYIRVADGKVYPKAGKVVVEADAVMQTLENSEIITNDTSLYHRFYEAKTNVYGRYRYKAEAKYDYVNEDGVKDQIFFNNIFADNLHRTRAEATIIEPDSFMLSPIYYFQGDVFAKAEQKELDFKGSFKIVSKCNNMGNNWIKFSTTIYPDSIYIPISNELLNIDRGPAYAGILMSNDSIHVYPSLFNSRKHYADNYVHTASGFLHYSKWLDKFEISSLDRMLDPELPGNYLALYQNPCVYKGQGKIDFNVNLWHVKLKAFGTTNFVLDSSEFTMNGIMTVDYMVPDVPTDIFTKHLDTIGYYDGRAEISDNYIRFLDELFYFSDSTQNLTGSQAISDSTKLFPKTYKHKLLLSDVNLKWNQRFKAYQSVGKFNLAAVGRKMIDLEMDGYIQISRKRHGDLLDIYLKYDEENWYYFGYESGVMHTLSSNKAYNSSINALKDKERKIKVKRGEKPYYLILSTNDKLNRFLRNFNTSLHEEIKADEPIQDEVDADESDDEKGKKKNKDTNEKDDFFQ